MNTQPKLNPHLPFAAPCLLGHWKPPIGRWMTFDEETMCMANYPLSEDMIWGGHKNNPRPETALVLSVLEKSELLRHVIRRAEVQKVRARLVGAGMFRTLLLLACWRKPEWWAYNFGVREWPNVEGDLQVPSLAHQKPDGDKESKL